MNRKFIIAITALLFCFFLTGCSESQQLHQKLIVQGMGIEKENEDKYKVTIQALDFQNPANEDEPNTKILETQGKTVMEALENISKQTSLKPVYSQNLILIIGEKAATSGVNDFMDFFIRHCETRPKVKICVSNTVSEILKIKPSDKSLKSRNIHDLIPLELNSDILHFISNLKNEKTDPIVAWVEMEEKNQLKEVHLKGIAIFKEDKLCKLLQDEEAFGIMLLKGVPNFGSYVINSDEFGEVTVSIEKTLPKINVQINKENNPKFNINLDVNATTFSIDKNFCSYPNEEINRKIEEKISEKVSSSCSEIIKKIFKLGVDIFEFSKILKNSQPSYFKKIEDDWKSFFPNLNFEIFTNVKLKVTGKEPV